MRHIAALVALTVLAGACSSPEAERTEIEGPRPLETTLPADADAIRRVVHLGDELVDARTMVADVTVIDYGTKILGVQLELDLNAELAHAEVRVPTPEGAVEVETIAGPDEAWARIGQQSQPASGPWQRLNPRQALGVQGLAFAFSATQNAVAALLRSAHDTVLPYSNRTGDPDLKRFGVAIDGRTTLFAVPGVTHWIETTRGADAYDAIGKQFADVTVNADGQVVEVVFDIEPTVRYLKNRFVDELDDAEFLDIHSLRGDAHVRIVSIGEPLNIEQPRDEYA